LRLTVSAACASGLLGVIRAVMLLESGHADRVLVVGVEASVHPLFLGSFARLGILAPAGWGCRPFDQTRRGFVMSEAAAAICLELIPASRPLAYVDRYAMAADASHLTGIDEQGRAYRFLLRRLLTDAPSVDLIHAHGTATEANDAVELAAIESVLAEVGLHADAEHPPALYSHKGSLGHTLGASGVISMAINVMAIQDLLVPPSPWLERPLPTRGVRQTAVADARPIHRSICLAAGFGGAMAAVSMMGVE
jgi:3-oxoacyl-[acyl-carrier-protein] synthase II